MKRILSAILILLMIAALFAACAEQHNGVHTLYFKDSTKSDKVIATFFNSSSGESEEVEMEKISEDGDSYTFSCEGDSSLYNMAYVTYGDEKKTDGFAFNPCTNGWYKTEDDLLPYEEGEEINYENEFDIIMLDAGYEEYKKIVHIWTPDDYDPSSSEKYATVYVLDGNRMAYFGDGQQLKGSEVVCEQVKVMTASTGKKAIVVAVENVVARDYELVPEIGESEDERLFGKHEFDAMNGSQLAAFFADTLVPYVQEHYNVYTDALHTSVAGGSLGGLEAFYIAVEYPDVFGTAGALSPSFWEYDDATWRAYLEQKTFDKNSPFLYFYMGGKETAVPPGVETDMDWTVDWTTQMVERLKDMGYPEEKMAYHFYDEGTHNSVMWRNVFPEFLEAFVYQRIEPLQNK